MVLHEAPPVWRHALRFPEARCDSEGEVVHLDERNWDSSVVSSIAQCYLDVGPAGKKGDSTAGSAKTGFFLAMRQRKTRPYHSEGALWGRSSFSLFIF